MVGSGLWALPKVIIQYNDNSSSNNYHNPICSRSFILSANRTRHPHSTQKLPPVPNLQDLSIKQCHFLSQIYQLIRYPWSLFFLNVEIYIEKFSSPALEFSNILNENLKFTRMYPIQNTFFHPIHWPNQYIRIPSLYLKTCPSHFLP